MFFPCVILHNDYLPKVYLPCWNWSSMMEETSSFAYFVPLQSLSPAMAWKGSSPLLFFSMDAEPLWACCWFCFCRNRSCPEQDKTTLLQTERRDWNVTFLLRLKIKVWAFSFLWGTLENPEQALLRLDFPCHKRSMWRTPPTFLK